jgi:eukaryotic-like serine/threonine-protein kinase
MDDPIIDLLEAIDAIADRFEQAWRSGQGSRIADHVQGVPLDQFGPLLRHLLRVEIELRREAGEEPCLRDYEADWPDHRDLIVEALEGWGGSEMGPAFLPPAPSTPVLDPDAPELDGYEIIGLSGKGGTGLVHKAWHQKLGRFVAIKTIRAGASVDRFLREARLIAQIHSNHVVAIYNFQVLPDGRQALVMEHVEGIDLARWIKAKDGPLEEAEVLPWMRQVADGMVAAADHGIIHRDLKPSNILIDSKRRAKVVDFGLGRGPAELADDLTRSHDILGTPYYMAIEQAEDPQGVDTRADIYSFGALFYHALTGVPPFEGKTAFSILYNAKTEPLVSPRARNPELSGWLNEFLERCLARSPADRFPSFAEVLRQLHPSVEAASPWDVAEDPKVGTQLEHYKAHRRAYLMGPPSLGYVGRYKFPRNRVLWIIRGDLALQEVEALVNSSSWDLPGDYGVSRALFEVAGEEVRRQAAALAPVRPGRVAVTSAGGLPARFLFHGVTSGMHAEKWVAPSRDLIAEIVSSCFYQADSLNVQSIAFPLLGTGAAGFDREVCLDTMFRSLVRTFLGGLTCVREARIIIYPLEGC